MACNNNPANTSILDAQSDTNTIDSSTTDHRVKSLNELTDVLLRDQWTVGGVVGIINQEGSLIQPFGVTEKGTDKRVDEHTRFYLGSISKVMTGILLAESVLRNEVNLDQSIDTLLPKNITPNKFMNRDISLLHLANHSSGYPIGDSTLDTAQLHRFIDTFELTRAPGTFFEFSNIGFALLGDLLSRNREMSYKMLLQTRILDQLQMNETYLASSLRESMTTDPLVTNSYDNELDFVPLPSFPSSMDGSLGLVGTGRDLAIFTESVLGIRESSLQPAIQKSFEHLFQNDVLSTALGWYQLSPGSYVISARTFSFNAWLIVVPEQKIGAFAVVNSADGWNATESLAKAALDLAINNSVVPLNLPAVYASSEEEIGMCTGRYSITVDEQSYPVNFTNTSGRLRINIAGEIFSLRGKSPSAYFITEFPSEILCQELNSDTNAYQRLVISLGPGEQPLIAARNP